MTKRSRETSFEPSGDENVSDMVTPSSEPEDEPDTKLIAYDESDVANDRHIIQCSLPPHTGSLGFSSLEDFEVHYAKEHTNRCAQCGKNMPSAHFLELHLDEIHNPLREALAARGEKTYACFVPDCEKMCSNPSKRRMHLIDKHGFPKLYNFHVVNDGIDNAKTLLREGRRRRLSTVSTKTTSDQQQTTQGSDFVKQESPSTTIDGPLNTGNKIKSVSRRENSEHAVNHTQSSDAALTPGLSDLDDLERSFTALQFVPRSVSSRHGKSRT